MRRRTDDETYSLCKTHSNKNGASFSTLLAYSQSYQFKGGDLDKSKRGRDVPALPGGISQHMNRHHFIILVLILSALGTAWQDNPRDYGYRTMAAQVGGER
ncbi:hypothetical protein IAD21_00943 [Abditibacteriota bacterium]|nr:hypothetical protein IAD21_00943 [Abditibacteriota bacterium]